MSGGAPTLGAAGGRSARLICPGCGGKTFYVRGSRTTRLGQSRRRLCSGCGHRVYTLEVVVVPGLRRAYRRLLRAMGEQMDLPLAE